MAAKSGPVIDEMETPQQSDAPFAGFDDALPFQFPAVPPAMVRNQDQAVSFIDRHADHVTGGRIRPASIMPSSPSSTTEATAITWGSASPIQTPSIEK